MPDREPTNADRPKILVVEAQAWEHERLTEKCGDCEIHTRSQTFEDLPDADVPDGVNVLSPFIHSDVGREQIERLGDLRLIATRSTGFDHIDLDPCRERGITVCNVPDYGENTVAEHTFALLLALTRKVHRSYERTIRGDFGIEGLRGEDLAGKTFACLGTGKIGAKALRIAAGFGMELIAFDVKPDEQAAGEIGFEYVELDELLSRAEVLSIHVPYNEKTHHMIDRDALSKMPDGAILVNTARGGVVDPQALIEALSSGKLGGAALDVLEGETDITEEAEILSSGYDPERLQTIVRNHALLWMPNVIITPHVAFNSVQAVNRIIDTTLDNIRAYFAGEPKNVVSE